MLLDCPIEYIALAVSSDRTRSKEFCKFTPSIVAKGMFHCCYYYYLLFLRLSRRQDTKLSNSLRKRHFFV